jgi:hypothetical protein
MVGATVPIMDPQRLRSRQPAAGREGHAPVVAVLVPHAKADESISAPKGHGPPDPCGFSPANKPFSGDRRKGP